MKVALFRRTWMFALLALLALPGCGGGLAFDDPLPDFSLTDQDGQTVTRDDLKGKVWVAAFIFTRCRSECLQITAALRALREDLKGARDVRLVSISVDPEHDTPAVLKQYAAKFDADDERWRFLTGPAERVHTLVEKGFFEAAEKNATPGHDPGNEVIHSPKVWLVDQNGHKRGRFDGTNAEEMAELRQKIALLNESYFPAVNAGLNALSGLLVVLGFVAVKARRIALHKACMFAALAASAIFLASYLYYHIVVRHGEPTRFGGPDGVRLLYFAILGSHTILAVAVAPLALYTAYQGIRDNIQRHVWLARFTLPMWLYVSVTGVIVYWMLYRLYPPV